MEGAIGLEVIIIVGRVGVNMQDWCPRDQLRVDGGICRVGLSKGGVISREGWVEYVSNDIGKGYASYPIYLRQDCPGFVEGLSGQGQVKGHRGIVGLLVAKAPFVLKLLLGLEEHDRVKGHPHKWSSWHADLALGAVLVLDPEYGKLKPCCRYFGNGLGQATPTHGAVDFAVAQLDEDLLVLQELFVVKGFGHRVGEAKNFLLPRDKVCLGVCGTHGCCGRRIGSKGRYKSVSIVMRQLLIIN